MLTHEVHKIIVSTVTSLGYELVTCEWQPIQGRSILRILIDSEKGITVKDCTLVSRKLGAALETENLLTDGYYLEVSSPGLDRPLLNIEHYQRFLGRKVKIKTKQPIENRRNFVGKLVDVQQNEIFIELLDGHEEKVVILFEKIEKANLVPEF
jgi:ribosome maturation factor RimP